MEIKNIDHEKSTLAEALGLDKEKIEAKLEKVNLFDLTSRIIETIIENADSLEEAVYMAYTTGSKVGEIKSIFS